MSAETPPPIYKFLTADMRSPMGTGDWTESVWRSADGVLVPCSNGFHGVAVSNLTGFCDATLWRAEIDGECVWDGRGIERKIVARRMRIVERVEAWNDRTARLFAADCAERVLSLFEQQHQNDDRPRRAIETARRFANGGASAADLDAAWAAASDAAWAAASDAAWAAASDAAWAAAWAAASNAARAAASNAARAAAWDAARAAARAAAWAAAWYAARAAEHEWQNRHLAEMLGLPWDVQP